MADLILVPFIDRDFSISELQNDAWRDAASVTCTRYWSGEEAPPGRRFEARLLWSNEFLYVRFETPQNEPLIVSESPNLDAKTIGLWDRDVCEIFFEPGASEGKYYEFEVAPTGEWVDLAISFGPRGREADTEFESGMQSAAKIRGRSIVSAIKIPWRSIGGAPNDGDVRTGNLFRCVGEDPGRGYIAWNPTFTEAPNFHVPERFGKFQFVK